MLHDLVSSGLPQVLTQNILTGLCLFLVTNFRVALSSDLYHVTTGAMTVSSYTCHLESKKCLYHFESKKASKHDHQMW